MKRDNRNLVQQVMDEPITLGGFTWSHGFLCVRFTESGMSLQGQNLCLMTAMKRGPQPNAPDTRSIPLSEQLRLWNAMSEGDCDTINSIVNEWWEFAAVA